MQLIPSGEIQIKVMENNNLYPREIQVYSELLPQIQKLLEAVGDLTQFAPKCLYSTNVPKMMLFFEDMKELGYSVIEKENQMDVDTAFLVLEKLAKLHAASAVLKEKNPSVMNQYLEGPISKNPNRQDFLIFYRLITRTLALIAENEWSSEWKSIAAKLKALEHTINEKGCDVYTRNDKCFNVFNHDDIWLPNILFKKKDVLFIDFQLSFYGSLGIDLNYMFYGTLKETTRISFKDQLIRSYHEQLVKTLKDLKYEKEIPSLDFIYEEIKKTAFHGVNAALCVAPISLMEHSDKAEMDLMLAESAEADAFRYDLMNGKKYQKFIKKLLLEFDGLKYLE